MAEPNVRIEIVPFPDEASAEPAPRSNEGAAEESAEPTPRREYQHIEGQGDLFSSRVLSEPDDAKLEKPLDSSPVTDDASEELSSETDHDATSPSPSPAVTATRVATATTLPTHGAEPSGSGSVRAHRIGPTSSLEPTFLAGADRAVPVDGATMRQATIASRVTLHTVLGVLAAVSVAVLAVFGVARTTDATREVARLGQSGEATATLQLSLSALHEEASVDEGTSQGARNALASLEQVTDDVLPNAVVNDVTDNAQAYLASRTQGGSPAESASELADFEAASDRLSRAISEARIDAVNDSESIRRLVVIALLVAVIGTVAVLAVSGRMIAKSVTAPLRTLARALRRFGDGDTSVRVPESFDEVGSAARSFNQMSEVVGGRLGDLSSRSRRNMQMQMVSEALEVASNEADIHRIVERAFGILTPGMPAELLLNDLTTNTLRRVAESPTEGAPACPVTTSAECLAMRQAKSLQFQGPAAINACPKLRQRDEDRSAGCVPVSVNGHMLGVLHVTGADQHPPDSEVILQLESLGAQIGGRISAMRTLETTRLQASTDGLTGLANRRMLEARMSDLLRSRTKFVLAVADLDRFKELNDQYGHEVGDRALQVFAKVLEQNVRGKDVVARYGGEEFVLVYPEMSVKTSIEVIDRIRAALAEALVETNLPHFTTSMGVTHSSAGDSVEALIRIADAGLLVAKDLGRNRVVFSDEELAAEVFGDTGATKSARSTVRNVAKNKTEVSATDGERAATQTVR